MKYKAGTYGGEKFKASSYSHALEKDYYGMLWVVLKKLS